jgi:hypothetical protein
MLAQQLGDHRAGAGRGRLARVHGGLDAVPGSGLGEAGRRAAGEPGLPLVHRRRRADQRDPAVAQPGQVLDAGRARRSEVQVDAGEPLGVGREPDQHAGPLEPAQHRHPLVVQLDVHHDDRVDQRGAGDPLQPLDPLVLGQQQHVVVVAAGRGHHGDGELHDHRHVDAGAQRDDQGHHVGPVAGQRAGPGVRVVAERLDALEHPLPGRLRDRPLAAQYVGHRARCDAGVSCHVVDLGQGTPARLEGCRSSADPYRNRRRTASTDMV